MIDVEDRIHRRQFEPKQTAPMTDAEKRMHSMTFGEELSIFSSEYPYREIVIDGVTVRYVLAGKKENPAIVFLNGLDMQEMWIRYVDALQENYCALMIEYPLEWDTNRKMVEGLHALLNGLGLAKPAIIGGSDGGCLAQLYAHRYPENVSGMVLITTLTVDSDYVRNIKKMAWMTPLLKLKLRMSNWEKLKQRLVKMVTGYFRGEGEQEEIYGRTFFDAITADPAYKDKYIHAVGLVGELAGKYAPFEKDTFAFLKGKVLLLLPDQDIFTKEDQERLVAAMTEPQVKTMKGGHLACIMRAQEYIEEIEAFLPKCFE